MSESKYPKEWLERVPAIVFASLAPGSVRIHLLPGNGLVNGGAPRDIDIEIIPRELRVPNTLLWARLDDKMNVIEVWRRDE
jgi:hypothetical protein